MKIETASRLRYESRDCKRMKMKLQVGLAMKVEIPSMLINENGNCRKYKVCLTMKIETASMLNYENRNCKYA